MELRSAGYHLDNLLLHAAGAAMLWRILRRLKSREHCLRRRSLPCIRFRWNRSRGRQNGKMSSAVCSISFRYGRIWRGALGPSNLAIRAETGPAGTGWYGLSLAFFLAALLSKSVASTMPAAILVLIWWKRGRIQARDFYPLIPMLAAGIGMGFLTGWMEKHVVGAIGPQFDFLTPLDRCCIAGRAFWFYLAKLLWPARLMFIYPHWNVDPRERTWWILFPLSACGLLIGCWLLRRRIGRARSRGCSFLPERSCRRWDSSTCSRCSFRMWRIIFSTSRALVRSCC